MGYFDPKDFGGTRDTEKLFFSGWTGGKTERNFIYHMTHITNCYALCESMKTSNMVQKCLLPVSPMDLAAQCYLSHLDHIGAVLSKIFF